MTAPVPNSSANVTNPPAENPYGNIVRRVLATAVFGLIFFGVLWFTIFNAVTAAYLASGGTVLLFAGASTSDAFESVFDTVANVMLCVLGAIAGLFAAIFSLFE